MGIPRLGMGVVDVRDLAEAHLKAGFIPEAQGRYIISAHNTDFLELALCLRDKYKSYPLPRKALPKWLAWLFGPLVDKSVTRKMVARNEDLPWIGDNSKSVRELGMQYRPMKQSIEEFFQQLIDCGAIPSK